MEIKSQQNRFRIYVPKDYRLKVFRFIHNQSHQGIKRTGKLLKQHFIWPRCGADISQFTKACTSCLRNKITRHVKTKPPEPYNAPPGRMATLHLDHITMRKSEEHRYCLTIIDRETNFFLVIPQRTLTTKETFRNLMLHQISLFGIPLVVISDRGSAFTSKSFKESMRQLGIEHRTTCSYHPQSNSKIERMHRNLKEAIRTAGKSDNWYQALPLITLALRASINVDDNYSPSEKLLGQLPRLPGLLIDHSEVRPFSDEDTRRLIEFLDEQKERIKRKRKTEGYFPRNLRNCKMVMVRCGKVKDKLSQTYEGPFLVTNRNEKYFEILRKRKIEKISTERLKGAYLLPFDIKEFEPDDRVNRVQKIVELDNKKLINNERIIS